MASGSPTAISALSSRVSHLGASTPFDTAMALLAQVGWELMNS